MKNARTRRIILSTLAIAAMIFSATFFSGYAQNYPDIDSINPTLYFSGNQQFFHRPNGGYALVSTDMKGKTRIALLNGSGEFDYNCGRKPITVSFTYEKAAIYGDFLYAAGWSSAMTDCVEIQQIQLNTGAYMQNKIINTACAFERDFCVNEEGISLVTAPLGTAIDSLTKPSLYLFDSEHDGGHIEALPFPSASSLNEESSAVFSSDVSSEASSTSSITSGISSTVSSASSSSPSSSMASSSSSQPPGTDKIPTYHFNAPVTVEALQKEIEQNSPEQKLRVLKSNHRELKAGNIGTGFILETIVNEKTESRYIAVIPGDLDGNGIVTEDDCAILYHYFTKPSSLKPSVLSGAYYEAALFSGEGSIDPTHKELQPGNLLKIKKLIK
jgi:hypothetical protein